MRTAWRIVALVLSFSLPCTGTLVLFQWTPQKILLAADSLSLKVTNTGITSATECKIHQEGDIFFTIVGINDDPAAKVDLVAIASRAARQPGDFATKVYSFTNLAALPIRDLWLYAVQKQFLLSKLATETNGVSTITVIFVSRREHAVAVKEYTGRLDGSMSEAPAVFHGRATGMRTDNNFVTVGVSTDAAAAASRDPNLSHLDGIPFITSFFQVQIAREQQRLYRHDTPRVGAPDCILEVSGGRAQWTPGQQGPCPDIRR